MTDQERTREERFAVRSRRFVLVVGYVLGAVAVWAFVSGRTALGIALVVVVFVLVLARGAWTYVRGMRAVRAGREQAQVPARPAAAVAGPSPVDQVVADLVGMNSDGLPYVLQAERTDDGVEVEVRWKSEDMRWQTLFVRGNVAYAWRMELELDPSRSQYRFTEYSGTSTTRAAVSPGGAFVRASWNWKRGKTAYQSSTTIVEGADGQVRVNGSGGPRTSWEGAVSIRPGDAKRPVFTVLRNHGWKPRFDWFGARLFEK